ncbi:MAG: AMP-binding protein, partial [Deltaproteobacteria bacterium]|nr:AMP-binding protein [Deltaproteobacteria bacterium]
MLTSFRPRFKTLLEIFEASTKRYPDRPLFGTKRRGVWVWTTYREFAEKVAKIRGGLAHLGVGKGDFVAIISNNRPEWAIAAYATYGRGAVLVPMYESQSPSEWAYICLLYT